MSLLFVLIIMTGYAQTKTSSIKPADLVQFSKTEGKDFKPVEMFARSPEKRNFNGELQDADYESLIADFEQLQQLKNEQPESFTLQLPALKNKVLEVEFVKVNIFSGGFLVRESSTNTAVEVDLGVHYRGVIRGKEGSIASLSIFEDEMMGLFSTSEEGNLVLGKVDKEDKNDAYVIYNDEEVIRDGDFYCGTPDEGPKYTVEEVEGTNLPKDVGDCVRIYFEVDHDIYQNKGGTSAATNYVTSIFNEVATLYANDDISVVISEIFVWNTPSPYSSNSSSGMLSQFQSVRTSFNGDLGQLLSYQASGGIAILDGLCHPYNYARQSFASINTTFAQVPTYSFTVMVVAHELGHLLGSHHTHACVWNGNNTAIDGCAGFVEGNCSNPGLPSGGGTIMSYCHISSAGINFTKGFGTQPANVIKANIASASCLQACSTNGNGGNGNNGGDCTDNQLILTLTVDDYGPETTWELKDDAGTAVASGGPYEKGIAGTVFRDTFCLVDGCYSFKIMDEYEDGICCEFGDGSYSLKDQDGNTLASGGEFSAEEQTNFCVPENGDGGGGDGECLTIDFADYSIDSYGGNQDAGTYQLQSGNTVLKIQNNAWKSIALDYTVTPNTVIEFDFGSTIQGEIHGIGFDDNNTISYSRTFKVHGTQSWGLLNFDNYVPDASWQRYTIPVGEFYTGTFDRLFFVSDHDGGARNGNSYFRNVRIYEGAGCGNIIEAGVTSTHSLMEEDETQFEVFPNPTQDYINLNFSGHSGETATIQLYNLTGQLLRERLVATLDGANRETLDVAALPQGTYFVRVETEKGQLSKTFNITRD